MRVERLDCEVLVVGSGPGGATTACLLAEAGKDVLVIEEGPWLALDSAPSYSAEEMEQKYRNGGLTPALGPTQVTYIEGRCVGGGSEINAGLYHRPIEATLADWRDRFRIRDFGPSEMETFFDEVEREVGVSTWPDGVGPASEALKAGAARLGWRSGEIARFWKYGRNPDGSVSGRRQSMSETLVPRAVRAGARVRPDTRVRRFVFSGARAVAAEAVTTAGGERIRLDVRFQHAFVCAGPIQSAALLRRSGVAKNVGQNLRLHPMIRAAARFRDPVNDPRWGVPVQQVEQFKPGLTLGCSHSSPPHVALWLEGDSGPRGARLREWPRLAVFYAAITGDGRGTVRALPGFADPLVRYRLAESDRARLADGLRKLAELVFAAGAVEMYNPIEGAPPLRSVDDARALPGAIPHGRANVTTIHLFGTCPMGEDPDRCAADSFGRVRGVENLRVNDASLLPDTPGVNPQGTVLAVARRNAQAYLG